MKGNIKLGYEVGSGKEVYVAPSHLIVTGITQQSGKTTTLEALISRSSFKAVVFKTKIGEKSFSSGNVIPPFFRDRSDYEFVKSLIEAYAKEKLIIEKGTLMTLCKGAKSLVEIKMRVDEALAPGKLRGLKEEIYTRLQHYLENLIPQIQYANLSSTLNLSLDGVNIMNLERFSEEAQSLIIQSVADEILKAYNNTVIVIPEAWKFLPQKYNNPCKRVVESFIRQGAANFNFVWIDSQDMAGVDKSPLKQISTWILGYQSERNEVKHTLDQISLPKASKPKEDDIMNLPIGHFFLSSRDGVQKVYVQPAWMDENVAKEVAVGNKDAVEASMSKPLPSFNFRSPAVDKPLPDSTNGYATKKDLAKLRSDFFTKIETMMEDVNNFLQNLNGTSVPEIDEEHIASLVLQKLPAPKVQTGQTVATEQIVMEVLKRLPSIPGGAAVYEVMPLEKIRKDFLQEAKDKILKDVEGLNEKQRKILKFVESQNKGCNQTYIIEKLFFLSATSGGTRGWVSKECAGIASLQLLRKDKNAVMYPNLKERIKELIGTHAATDVEIETTYSHILNELL